MTNQATHPRHAAIQAMTRTVQFTASLLSASVALVGGMLETIVTDGNGVRGPRPTCEVGLGPPEESGGRASASRFLPQGFCPGVSASGCCLGLLPRAAASAGRRRVLDGVVKYHVDLAHVRRVSPGQGRSLANRERVPRLEHADLPVVGRQRDDS